jgi:Domain of unknown function (DUF4349)
MKSSKLAQSTSKKSKSINNRWTQGHKNNEQTNLGDTSSRRLPTVDLSKITRRRNFMRENIDNHQRKKTTKMGSSRVNGNGGTVMSSFPITHKRWIIPFILLLCLCPIFILLIGIMTQPSALIVSASLTENFHDGGASYSSQLRHEKAGFGGGASSAAVAGTVGHSLMAAKSTLMHQSPRMQSEMVAADAMTMGEQVVEGLNDALDRLDSKRYTDHRMLVHEGDMKLVTLQGTLEYLTEQIRSLVSSSDGQGYVESQQSFDRSYNHGEYDTSLSTVTLKGIYMTVRIASGQYFEIIQKIRAILSNDPLVKGRVVYVNTKSRDVTDEFVDAASRADVVDASRTSLLSLLKQASSLDDVFRLQREINRLTETYESHKSRANALEKQAVRCNICILAVLSFCVHFASMDIQIQLERVYTDLTTTNMGLLFVFPFL